MDQKTDRREEILKIIKYFHDTYGINEGPGTGYLAGIFKVSQEMIRKDLKILEDLNQIKRIKSITNFTSYVLVQKKDED